MNTPEFWAARGPIAWLLYPFSLFYPLMIRLRFLFTPPVRMDVPVICVGGLTAGGAGKTPTALHIGTLCKSRGINAWFVSRGYKGTLLGPLQVSPSGHTSQEVGDEPLLLANVLPTIIAKNRLDGIRFALRHGAELIITDDGFQNPSLHKDLSLLVIDGKTGLGNGLPIPAGPLREWPEQAYDRADAIIHINPQSLALALPQRLPVLTARTVPDKNAELLKGKSVLAFCGLAIPEKFLDTLRQLGANVIETRIFADHYPYHEREIEQLAEHAQRSGAILATTSKDAARLPDRLKALVTVVPISLQFDAPEMLDALLNPVMTKHNEKEPAIPD
ncbi:MAG: tetraacyldisaccharide 4'-kinase [Alphaproteobacteria bacterium]